MKNYLTLILTIVLVTETQSQVVIGKMVDENGDALSSINLQLYIDPDIYNTTTSSDGSFIFDLVTGAEEERIPSGYAVSNNFPNPFNPTTRIGITLPIREDVRIEVFNLLGQEVIKPIEQTYEEGTNFVDIELNGLANGVYTAKVTIGDKHIFVKKMMLVYGSGHLTVRGAIPNTELHKANNSNLGTNLDSLIATSQIIGRKTFTGLPSVAGDTLDLGYLIIERYCIGTPTVEYEGKTYHTVQIGSQCWLKENLDVGIMINGHTVQVNNGIVEKYCYNNDTIMCNIYGGLYQWHEAMQYTTTAGVRGICPTEWHLPTIEEFQTLSTTVGDDGDAMKAIGQGTGTNRSGFSALLTGYRDVGGIFQGIGGFAHYWTSSEYDGTSSYRFRIQWDNNSINITPKYKALGFGVRCLQD